MNELTKEKTITETAERVSQQVKWIIQQLAEGSLVECEIKQGIDRHYYEYKQVAHAHSGRVTITIRINGGVET